MLKCLGSQAHVRLDHSLQIAKFQLEPPKQGYLIEMFHNTKFYEMKILHLNGTKLEQAQFGSFTS